MFRAMGWETAHVHLAQSEAIAAIQKDLAKRGVKQFMDGAEAMIEATRQDWKDWRKSFRQSARVEA
jgi:hypothetical protein